MTSEIGDIHARLHFSSLNMTSVFLIFAVSTFFVKHRVIERTHWTSRYRTNKLNISTCLTLLYTTNTRNLVIQKHTAHPNIHLLQLRLLLFYLPTNIREAASGIHCCQHETAKVLLFWPHHPKQYHSKKPSRKAPWGRETTGPPEEKLAG